MKKIFTCTFLLAPFFWVALSAQTTQLQVKINHKLSNEDFAFSAEAENDSGDIFIFNRMEYYLSGFSLLHDGTTTAIPDLHFLVKADENTVLDLGEVTIENLTEIRFHTGVAESVNHEDPAAWPADHPLAPQAPSMHWGWAAGYRFVAAEGKSGANLLQDFQLHGLGDDNYFEARVPVSVTITEEVTVIEIDADYTAALKGINVGSGVISHGETGEAKVCLENFRNEVFSATDTDTGIIDYGSVSEFSVFPNPAHFNTFSVAVKIAESQESEVRIYAADGTLISVEKIVNAGTAEVRVPAAGIYFVRLAIAGETVGYEKVIVR